MASYAPSMQGPFPRSEVVDISSGDHAFSEEIAGFYVGGAGNIFMRLQGDSADIAIAVAAGSYHPLQASHIRRTKTTATGIVGLLP